MIVSEIIAQIASTFGEDPTDTSYRSMVLAELNNVMNQLIQKSWWYWRTENELPVFTGQSSLSLPKSVGKVYDISDTDEGKYTARSHGRQKTHKTAINSNGNKTYAMGTTSASTLYSTGTASCTAGSATITGVGTTWDATMVGRLFVIGGNEFVIVSVESTTSLTVHSNSTVTSAGSSYQIEPPATKRLVFLPEIGADTTLTISYFRHPATLVNDDDIPDLPEHYHGYLVWRAREILLQVDEERAFLRDSAEREAMKFYKAMSQENANLLQVDKPRIISRA